MFEIEIVHKDLFEDYLAKGIAYKNGIYDFTFENRYLIYHIERKTIVSYIAIDMTTDRSSRIVSKKHSEMYSNETYHTMIPDILYSVKHTGDRRYLCSMAYYNIEPIEMINTIFRVVLPNYGYAVREAQINLCIDMFKGLTKKQRSLLLEEKKKDCFSTFDFVEKFCVPNMLIKLRQGVGRLIRTETDTGVVTILDERVARGGRYRHRVFNTFKKFGKAKSIVALRLFLEKVKPKEYWENKNEKGE